MKTHGKLKVVVFVVAVAIVPFFAMADRIARHADGSPIRVRVERKAGAPTRLLKAAGVEGLTSELLANWGVTNRVTELRERKRETDRYGRTHVRYRQVYCGIEVDGRELIVHEKDGEVYEVNGEFLSGLDLGVDPTRQVAGGRLVVWCKGRNAKDARLAWRVGRKVRGRRHWDFVDDKTGEVLQTRRAGAAAKMTDDDPGDDEEESEDEYIKLIDTAKLEQAAIEKAYPEGTPVTITGNLPWQMGGAEVSVEGIGVENAAKIAYQVLTAYCGPRTDYRQVREYWLDAAIDMIEADKPNGEPWDEDDIAITNSIVKAWAAVMPFDKLEIELDGVDEGDSLTVVGLAKWDGETVKKVDSNGKIAIWVPSDLNTTAFCIFRIEDSMFQVLSSVDAGARVQSLDEVSHIDSYKPDSSDDIRITEVKVDMQDREILLVVEVKDGDKKAVDNKASPTISDLLRLRHSATPNFDDAEDLDIAKCKHPFADNGEIVPDKYNIVIKLPKDASSGFYRLEW